MFLFNCFLLFFLQCPCKALPPVDKLVRNEERGGKRSTDRLRHNGRKYNDGRLTERAAGGPA